MRLTSTGWIIYTSHLDIFSHWYQLYEFKSTLPKLFRQNNTEWKCLYYLFPPRVIYNKLWKPASFITIPSQSLSPIDSKEPMCLFLPFQQFFLLHVPAFCFSPVHHHIWKILKLRILDHSPNRFIHGEMLESKGILWVRWSLTNEMPTQVALSLYLSNYTTNSWKGSQQQQQQFQNMSRLRY